MSDVTLLLSQIQCGNSQATDELLLIVYDELRSLARKKLSHERVGHTLEATALVHEVYMRLIGGAQNTTWQNRAHFFGAAAEAMRRILIDQARRKCSQKRQGHAVRVELDEDFAWSHHMQTAPEDLMALDDALCEFEKLDPLRAQVVKLHYYTGLTLSETADAMGVSLATVKRYWVFARSWLYGKIQK